MSTLAQQCRRKAEAGGYTNLITDAKWRELCFAFAAFEKKPVWRMRERCQAIVKLKRYGAELDVRSLLNLGQR